MRCRLDIDCLGLSLDDSPDRLGREAPGLAATSRLPTPIVVPKEKWQMVIGPSREVDADRLKRRVVEEDDSLFASLSGNKSLAQPTVLNVRPVEARNLSST